MPERSLHLQSVIFHYIFMISWDGNIFWFTGALWEKSPVTGGFPSQRPVTRSLMITLICICTNGWANNQDAGDLMHNGVQYDVIVMLKSIVSIPKVRRWTICGVRWDLNESINVCFPYCFCMLVSDAMIHMLTYCGLINMVSILQKTNTLFLTFVAKICLLWRR